MRDKERNLKLLKKRFRGIVGEYYNPQKGQATLKHLAINLAKEAKSLHKANFKLTSLSGSEELIQQE